MLIQNSLPSSIEASLFCFSEHGKQYILYDRIDGAGTWQMCSKCNDLLRDACKRFASITEDKENVNCWCSLHFPVTSSQLSTVNAMSKSCPANLVYKRRKLQESTIANPWRSIDCFTFNSSDTSLVAAKEENRGPWVEHVIKSTEAPITYPLSKREPHVSNVESAHGVLLGKELVNELPKINMQNIVEVDSINDSCSSSKSNVEHVLSSTKIEVEETGECSSSGALIMEDMGEDLSEKDFCIYVLRSHGLLGRASPFGICASVEDSGNHGNYYQSCKICGKSETTIKMLICDYCEDAFHLSCCNPRVRKIPGDEWYCNSCLEKRHIILKGTFSKKLPNINSVMRGRQNASSSNGDSNPIALLLRDTESYMAHVRVGKGFQAEVRDWSGPIDNDVDSIGEPMEMDPSEFVSLHQCSSNMSSRVSSIGNWLQCQQVLDGPRDGLNGTTCGKWRRAPLFEVQTDDWECFCSVLWDPTHADCAVPQELETEEVLKQLKYIEKLRPRLLAKRKKWDKTKSNVNSEKSKTLY